MKDVFYLAWRYLAHHRVKSTVLVASITLILFIPSGLRVLVNRSEQQLTARAAATPLLIGRKGSPTELVLNSLYFSTDVPERMEYGEVARIDKTGFALPIPLYARFFARQTPIVGTTLDYFSFRGLRIARGRMMARLGECVVGARTGHQPGDYVTSSPETVFDIAGVYPLKMRVAGVLATSDGPDDEAIFVDIKTAWIIEGRAHGHGDLKQSEILKRKGQNAIANRSVREYQEITDQNIGSFHLHGDPNTFPITAVIAVPHDQRAATLLMGRYETPEERHQVVVPSAVLDQLLATILTVQAFVVAALVIVGAATLTTAALVFMLSLRLRKREIETMVKIGGSKARIASILVAEIAGVILLGAVLAALLTWMTYLFGADAARALITS